MENQTTVTYHIKSAKTRKKKDFKVLDVAYKRVTQRENGKISVSHLTETGDDIVRPELIIALKAFVPHFLLLAEIGKVNDYQPSYFKEEKWKDEPNTYEVTGIHIKELNEKRYVIMVGRRNLKSGRVISMNIPMVGFDPSEEEEDVYPLHKHLKEAVDNFLAESEEYLSGNFGEPTQPELPLKKGKSKEEDKPKAEATPAPEGDALDKVIETKKGSKTTMRKVS